MPDQSPHKDRADEVTDGRARELLHEIGSSESIRASIAPFAGFVLALIFGRRLAGESVVRIDEIVFGFPLAWLVGWMGSRKWDAAWAVAVILVGVVGLAIGLLDPG